MSFATDRIDGSDNRQLLEPIDNMTQAEGRYSTAVAALATEGGSSVLASGGAGAGQTKLSLRILNNHVSCDGNNVTTIIAFLEFFPQGCELLLRNPALACGYLFRASNSQPLTTFKSANKLTSLQ